jgi:hypothetical protein
VPGQKLQNLPNLHNAGILPFAFNEKLESFDDFMNYYKDVKYKCFTDATTEKIIEKLPDHRFDSSIKKVTLHERLALQFKRI